MDLYELIIIYLASGAPFAAYRHLQGRNIVERYRWLRTALVFVFWVPYAGGLLWKSGAIGKVFDSISGGRVVPETDRERKISGIRREFETDLSKISPDSLYVFREGFDRYVGLTLATRFPFAATTDAETEIAMFGGQDGSDTAAAVLHRRNLKRLAEHQIRARREFHDFVCGLELPDRERLGSLAAALAETIGDDPESVKTAPEPGDGRVLSSETELCSGGQIPKGRAGSWKNWRTVTQISARD